jgi:hypothetical protein
MYSFRAFLLPAFGNIRRILTINGRPIEIPLRQPHTTASLEINSRYDDHIASFKKILG